jgi:hypothetical protein
VVSAVHHRRTNHRSSSIRMQHGIVRATHGRAVTDGGLVVPGRQQSKIKGGFAEYNWDVVNIVPRKGGVLP